MTPGACYNNRGITFRLKRFLNTTGLLNPKSSENRRSFFFFVLVSGCVPAKAVCFFFYIRQQNKKKVLHDDESVFWWRGLKLSKLRGSALRKKRGDANL